MPHCYSIEIGTWAAGLNLLVEGIQLHTTFHIYGPAKEGVGNIQFSQLQEVSSSLTQEIVSRLLRIS